MRTTDVALHDLDRGKGNRQGARHVEQEGAGQIATDVGYAFARATRSSKYGSRRICDVAWTRGVLLSLVQSVRVVGIRGR